MENEELKLNLEGNIEENIDLSKEDNSSLRKRYTILMVMFSRFVQISVDLTGPSN